MGTREVAQRYMDNLAALNIAEAFGMIAEDGKYTIIGKHKAAGTYHGRKDMFDRLVPLLAGMKQPPTLTFSEPVISGDRAILFASGTGIGPTGIPYSQPYYCFATRVRGEEIVELIEFLDTAEMETGLFGKKIVDA